MISSRIAIQNIDVCNREQPIDNYANNNNRYVHFIARSFILPFRKRIMAFDLKETREKFRTLIARAIDSTLRESFFKRHSSSFSFSLPHFFRTLVQ